MTEGPPSRQRSCNACVKSKRKCGMEWPKCTRCLSKDIDCVYPSSRTAPAAPGGPALDPLLSQQSLSWSDGLTQEPGMVPWSGELQTQMATIMPAPQFIETSVEEVVRTTLPPLDTDAAVHIFKSWPDKWLREGKAPFIHPQLYNGTLPQPLQEAYAACAIYATTTPTNRHIAFNIIESKVNALVGPLYQDPRVPLDLLASVQALLIFQLIRLFDGDIRLRASAEIAANDLRTWTEELDARTQEAQHFTTNTAPSWGTWVFSESVRRTITMSYFLSGIYSLVKQGYCTVATKVVTQSFTAQRAIWEAKSELDWLRAKGLCKAFWISNMDFQEVLRDASGSELDDFGVMLMIVYGGKDTVDHWLEMSNVDWRFVNLPDIRQSLEFAVQDIST